MKRSVRKRVNLVSIEIALIVITFVIFLPILLGITMSIQPPESVFAFPPKLFPTGFHWRNYTEAFRKFPFEYFLMNSLIIGLATTLGKIVTGILAGYAFANFRFFWKELFFRVSFRNLVLACRDDYDRPVVRHYETVRLGQYLLGVDHPVYGFGDQHLPIQTTLPLDAERTGGRGEDRRRRIYDLLLQDTHPSLESHHRRIGDHQFRVRLEYVSLASDRQYGR